MHIFQEVSITVLRYVKDAFLTQVRLLTGAVDTKLLLMKENFRMHQTHVVSEYLKTEDIIRMEWTPYTPG